VIRPNGSDRPDLPRRVRQERLVRAPEVVGAVLALDDADPRVAGEFDANEFEEDGLLPRRYQTPGYGQSTYRTIR
jgi:hypothetical protein